MWATILTSLFLNSRSLAEITAKEGVCSGTLPKEISLAPLKIDAKLLKSGVECLTGDFDGDGKSDFALVSFVKLPNENNTVRSHWRLAFVMAKGNRVLVAPGVVQNKPELFPASPAASEMAKLKKNGCPISHKLAGVIAPGEGDNTVVFFWDKDFDMIKRLECGSD